MGIVYDLVTGARSCIVGGDWALVPLRIVSGLLFWFHGAQKLGLFGGLTSSGDAAELMSRAWFAGVIEFTAGLAIACGIFTRLAAFVASGEMAFAYFLSHAPRGPWPVTNGGELAVVYCFLWLFLAFRGAGGWSIDAVLPGRRYHPSTSFGRRGSMRTRWREGLSKWRAEVR